MPVSSPAELLTVEVSAEILPPGGGPWGWVYIANQSFFLLEVQIDGSQRSPLQSGNNSPYSSLERTPGDITSVKVTPHLYPGQTPPPAGASSAVSVTWYAPRETPPGPGFSPVFGPPVDVTATVPIGIIEMYGGAAAPAGWAICDGSALNRVAFADLFAVLGVAWGPGNGTTTFNLPDFRGRAPVGAGAGSGLTNRALGSTFGAETVTLNTAAIPAHLHPVVDPTHTHLGSTAPDHTHGVTDPGHLHGSPAAGGGLMFEDPAGDPLNFDVSGGPLVNFGNSSISSTGIGPTNGSGALALAVASVATGVTTDNAGGGGAHANVQPSAAVTFIIKTS